MAQNGKGLAAFALIVAILGAGAGGYMIADKFFISADDPNDEPYIVPRARVYRLGGYSLGSGAATVFDFTNTSYDTHNAFNMTTDEYIVPESGFYQIFAQFSITAYDADFFSIRIRVNGTYAITSAHTASYTTNYFGVSAADIINVTAGDRIDVYAYSYNAGATSRAVFCSESYTYFSISKLV